MFDVRSDERLNAIQHRAGFIAFWSYCGMTLILAILLKSIDDEALHDPYFVLAVPWLISMTLYVLLHFGKGFFRTIRDEANKTPKQTRETRLRLLLGTVLFAPTMFLIKHFNIFDDDAATIGSDLLESCVIAVIFGLTLWFTQARKVRGLDE
jgi:membrane protein CcdC involved in cytochrome C biogenesis